MIRSTVFLLLPLMCEAANYSASTTTVGGIEVVRLADAAHHAEVSVAPSIGNMAYELRVNGKNALWTPTDNPADIRAKRAMGGIPFLAPWANRLDQYAFYANGKKYELNRELGNVHADNNGKPIHGLLTFSPDWKVTAVQADGNSAWVTSRLEFWKYPDLMAQFPFAHTIEMTYRLRNGALEVTTTLESHSTEPMPVGIGFHPYFQLHDAPRDEWRVHLAARDHMVLSHFLIPTGERKPVEFPDPLALAGNQLDDVFSNLVRGEDGMARFSVQGKSEKITVVYGPKYPIAVVYAPPRRGFICFEPMSAITDAFNLAHSGVYKGLQTIAPGGTWTGTFRIEVSGF